jgi:hypothetical protein
MSSPAAIEHFRWCHNRSFSKQIGAVVRQSLMELRRQCSSFSAPLRLSSSKSVLPPHLGCLEEFQSVLDVAPLQDVGPVAPFVPQFVPFVEQQQPPKRRRMTARPVVPRPPSPDPRGTRRLRDRASDAQLLRAQHEDVAIGPKPTVAYQKPMAARNGQHCVNVQ